MKFEDVKHNSTRKAIIKWGITDEELNSFETIEALRVFLLSKRCNSWKKNNRYMQERYKNDPEYREKIKQSSRNSYHKKKPLIEREGKKL